MAVRWSSENVVAEHRDLQATAMALDWRGDFTLLAGRRNLALISLEKPSEIVKKVNRTQQKYDVTAAEWNPKQAQGHTFVLASGEKAEICQWTDGSLNGITTLRAHTRTITDLNWHRSDPYLLATCSIDTFVHIWDSRETRKPIASLSAIAGASQVKWNKLNQHLLASGHDCDIRVWDHRKPSQPIQYIAAHLSKIQGLDWSPNHENHLVTSSNDCTVKFFDIHNPRKAENFISTPSPVWRARYTPFGEGVVTVVVPQLRRGENSLLLWSVTDTNSPVHTFVGHSDVVLEFEWRQNLSNPGDYQLVTWARDHSLRIWKIDHQLQRLCGHDTEEEVMESTDSEYASETTPVPCPEVNDLEVDGERTDFTLTNSDSSQQKELETSVVDGHQPGKPLDVTKFSVEVVAKETTKVIAGTPQDEVVESVMTQPSGSMPSAANASQSPSHPVTNFTSTLPAASKASTSVVGLSSTLPAGSSQPMTLQQEFSLLNTSLDNNQVNSVEVVTGGVVKMDECRDPKFNQEGVGKFAKLDEGLKQEEECHRHVVEEVTLRRDPMESSGKITETDNQLLEQTSNGPEEVEAVLDNTLGDSSALEHTVADLVRELGANGNDDGRQAFTACDLNTLRTEENRQIANNEGSGIENQDGLFELRNVDVMEGGQSVNGVSEGDIKSLAVSYLLGLDTKKDLVGSSRNLHDSHIIKIKSYTDDLGILETVENKYNKNKCIVGEQSSLRISFSSESEMVSTDAVMRSNSRVRISPQDLEGWLSDSSDMISLIPGVTLEEGGELTGTGEAIVKKEEAVIHIMDGESMNETNELLTPSSFMPGKEMGAAGVSTLSEAEEMVAETPSLMLSLPFVTSQATMNVAVMEGTILIKGSKDESLQVPAKVVCLPESDESNLEPPEEACAAFAPQLLEGGVLVLGDNIIMMKNQLYLTHVELVAAEGDTHTQISISPPTDRMETYHNKKVNFVLITLESDQSIGPPTSSSTNQKLAGFSQGQEDRLSVHNAPHSDEPGLFQCDKCYKSYKVRSSLNSHKVTHNSEKMYKCDECDKAFHYSTPLQIHKRIHTDERPYKCDGCSASFRSKANLKYHKRLHTGERPIACRECDQCFKDYTSLKRHRLKVHNMSSLKCSKCSEVSLSLEHLAAHMWQVHDVLYVEESPNSCEKCGESFSDKRAYNNHMVVHERRNKAGHVGLRKLTDYTHKCGICNMTCQNKTQMLVHIQVHAAVKRFKCRYCNSAFIYRFLLAEHVREEHPDNPEWFCQYCDEVFETCRKMTSHSCRTVRGDYNCPHCSFKTEVRHRLFRHIVKMHPEDKMPYYCEFCKNSFEDPNKLRYHQKREHPEKMLALSLQRDSTKSGSGGKDKGGESPNIDLSQVEMTIEGNTLIYFIPEDLRNDDVFKEKVKFKCFYCEAKFPIKNSMTRHILREHPGEKAYKCLQCNIFLKSNTESKNHHRRYHKFSATGGRDPNRNERAMMKKAQWLQDQLNNSDSRIKNLYKFNCRFCPMVYREKRSLVAHYRKWHPDEEWDYLPDKPIHSPPQATRKKRILIYYDCSFHDDCHAVFDDAAMLREHLFNAHNIAEELTEKYISKRLVIDHLRRGRLPKNAIDKQVKRQRCGKGKPESRKGSVTPTDNTDSDNEEGVDDPPMDLEDTSDSKFGLVDSLQETLSTESVIPGTDDVEVDKKMPNLTQHLSEQQTREDNIGSLRDVKKMLYRCHRCSRSFPSRSEYREHVAQARHTDCRAFVHHLDIKQEPPDEEDESLCRREFHSSYKSSVDDINESEGTAKAKKPRLDRASVKMEVEVCHNEEESIAITSLEERDEALLRVLSIHAPELSPEPVDVKVGMPLGIFDQMDKVCSASSSQIMGEGDAASASEASNVNLREIDRVGVKPTVIEEEAEMNKNAGVEENSGRAPEIGIERRGSRRGKGKRERGNEQKAIEERNRGGKKERAVQKKVCEQCCAAFKTRAELSFHLRFDH